MTTMEIHDILKYLPHRYPFLLVDRVLVGRGGQVASTPRRTSASTSRSFPATSRITR